MVNFKQKHFINKETEAQRGYVACQRSHSCKQQTRDRKPARPIQISPSLPCFGSHRCSAPPLTRRLHQSACHAGFPSWTCPGLQKIAGLPAASLQDTATPGGAAPHDDIMGTFHFPLVMNGLSFFCQNGLRASDSGSKSRIICFSGGSPPTCMFPSAKPPPSDFKTASRGG